MPWTYSQSTGRLTDPEGQSICAGNTGKVCYSGGGGRNSQNQPKYPGSVNNSQHENMAAQGPIPRGQYKMVRLEVNGGTYINSSGHSLGPYVIALEAVDHSAYGRSGFKVHGDNHYANKSASEGCIIAERSVRETLWASEDKLIDVVL